MTDDYHDTAMEESLRAALLPSPGITHDDPAVREAEARALAAFRTARDAGLHRSRPTRPRDDWTPSAERRRPGRSLKAAVAAVLASVTLGGVAIAAADLPGPLPAPLVPAPEPRPGNLTPDPATPLPDDGTTQDTSDRPERRPAPPHAKNRDALCHVYESAKGKRKARESPAWQRLVTEAGGEEHVPTYCGENPRPGPVTGATNGPRNSNRGASPQTAGKGSEQPRPAHRLGKTRPDKF